MKISNPYIAPATEHQALPIAAHRHLGWSLLIATLGTIALTSIACKIGACLALDQIYFSLLGEDLFYGITSGVIGSIPISIATCCFKDSYRLAVASVGALIWAWLTGACYNYLVYAIANC